MSLLCLCFSLQRSVTYCGCLAPSQSRLGVAPFHLDLWNVAMGSGVSPHHVLTSNSCDTLRKGKVASEVFLFDEQSRLAFRCEMFLAVEAATRADRLFLIMLMLVIERRKCNQSGQVTQFHRRVNISRLIQTLLNQHSKPQVF